MSKEISNSSALSPEERALMLNDLSRLSPEQRSSLYVKVCQSVGLNPLTQPFQYLELNGKLVLYASRNCTDQLRSVKNVSLEISSREKHGTLYVVTAKASLPNDRFDESMAAVDLSEPDKIKKNGSWIDNPKAGQELRGDALANLIMKAETKAKRRVTLSICGLSFMDETEVETVRDAKPIDIEQIQAPLKDAARHVDPLPTQEHAPTADQDSIEFSFNDDDSSGKSEVAIDRYVIPFGKFTGRSLREVGLEPCQKYAEWLQVEAEKRGKQITGPVGEFISMVDLYSVEGLSSEEKQNYQNTIGPKREQRADRYAPSP